MYEFFDINKPEFTDLSIYRCGIEDCAPGHSWGPGVRDHFLIHYVIRGNGIFRMGNSTYHLTKGEGFVLWPNKLVFYQADNEEPWSYCWLGFNGLKAETYLKYASLSTEKPLFRYEDDQFIQISIAQMIAAHKLPRNRDLRLVSLLYSFMLQFIEAIGNEKNSYTGYNRKEIYVKTAIEFIRTKFSSDISIVDISHYVGIDRKYLCVVFKECLNTTPQKFLVDFRINKACELMEYQDLSIREISYSVGYDNPLIFSKVFKKNKGLSPREYRNQKISFIRQ